MPRATPPGTPPADPPRSVVVAVYPGFQLLDATGPLQVFATAIDEFAEERRPPPYAIRLVSREGGLVRSSAGVQLLTEPLPDAGSLSAATLLVAGGQGVDEAARDPALLDWVRAAASTVGRCCSVCSGAFVLASAGLLDHRQAVTHWRDVDALRRHHPTVQVLDDALYVRDGSVYTSAGVTAGIDLSLALVEQDLGRALALRVARRLVVYLKRPGGQRQFSAALRAQGDGGGLVDRLTQWLKPRLRQSIDVPSMAAAMAVSERSLHRQLLHDAGSTPAAFLVRLRVEAACALLEDGALPLKAVADRSGFGSEYNLRRAFLQRLGVLPSAYRSRFT